MIKVPEEFRFFRPKHPLSTTKEAGNNGTFVIPHYKITGYVFVVQATEAVGWEHVLVQVIPKQKKMRPSRYPTWQEVSWIKSLFWPDTDTVLQYHPNVGGMMNYSSQEFALHLWRPAIEELIPIPEKIKIEKKEEKKNDE
jgi:hypothetical protein